MQELYREKTLLITEEGVTIFRYYFPFGQPKKLAWSQIKKIKMIPLSIFNGKLRSWGMELYPYWFNFGWRADKETMFVIDSGKFFKAAITPDDVDTVRKIFVAQNKLES